MERGWLRGVGGLEGGDVQSDLVGVLAGALLMQSVCLFHHCGAAWIFLFLFYFQVDLLRCVPQVKDRALVATRMKQHVGDPETTPLLIFPEGTCVNNEYCVMFKRGAFDLGAVVCPVALKYNKIFVDAFWNSKRQSFTAHIVRPHRWAWGSGVQGDWWGGGV